MWTRDKHLLEPYETDGFAGQILTHELMELFTPVLEIFEIRNLTKYESYQKYN